MPSRKVRIDADHVIAPVDPRIYDVFMEPIGFHRDDVKFHSLHEPQRRGQARILDDWVAIVARPSLSPRLSRRRLWAAGRGFTRPRRIGPYPRRGCEPCGLRDHLLFRRRPESLVVEYRRDRKSVV